MTVVSAMNVKEPVASKTREKGNTLSEELEALTTENPVILFMKGNRFMPQCGFSAHVVGLLSQYTDNYATVDILSDMDIRQGLKEYSNWPTYPQLYVDGKFVGGCDIISEMDEDGELAPLLEGK